MSTPNQGRRVSLSTDGTAGGQEDIAAGRATSRAWGPAARRLSGDPVVWAVFAAVLVLGLLMYRVWLPIPSVAMSIALSLALAVVFALQAHALRSTVRAHGSGSRRGGVVGGLAFVLSCLPCFVGLTPAVPALLAVFGTSAAATTAATHSVRHALMGVLPWLLAASLALLVVVAVWSFARLAAAQAPATTRAPGTT